MHLLMPVVYFLSCLLLGYFGRKKKLTFWGYFFGSILLTPIVGLLLVIASDPIEKDD